MFPLQGSYMQVGDIVSMTDEAGDVYYAQVRGFMTDQYCEKSAAVTWLLPTKASPPPSQCFDPATYIIGNFNTLSHTLNNNITYPKKHGHTINSN